MMDGKTLRNKLVGSEDERAVSPVIGVILMVAITVILAAVIATLVMDFGDSTDAPINAQVSTEVVDNETVLLTVSEPGDAESFSIAGAASLDIPTSDLEASTGSSYELDIRNDLSSVEADDQLNIIAEVGDREEQAGSFDVPEDYSP